MGPHQLDQLIQTVCAQGKPATDEAAMAALWRQGVAEYQRLETVEAGAADNPRYRELPKAAAPQAQAVMESTVFQKAFSTVQVCLCLVELERLVVSQYHLTLQNVERLQAGWPARLGPARLASICLPVESGAAPFQLAFEGENSFEFVSDTHDMRFIAAQVLRPADVPGLAVRGHAQAVVALAVGFSVNVLSVVQYQGRMVLHNGYHRAYALRRAGVKFVPCLVQSCGSMEEVRQAGSRRLVDHSGLYFEAPRPPMLRDFDNPLLAHAFELPRQRRHVVLDIETQSRLKNV